MSPDVTGELADAVVAYECIRHSRTETAREEAAVVGVPENDVAKTVIVATEGGFVRAVVPASRHVDLHKLRRVLGAGANPRLATEAELVGAYPMFELGAVPPFGGPEGDTVVLDTRIAEHGPVVVEAGSHNQSIRLAASDLHLLTHARVADICGD